MGASKSRARRDFLGEVAGWNSVDDFCYRGLMKTMGGSKQQMTVDKLMQRGGNDHE
jgi:hypothetical protein